MQSKLHLLTMNKSKEWLLLNAIECWLYYCDEQLQYTQQYKVMRDEYRELVAAHDSKDATKDEAPKPTRTTRSRTTKSTK